MSEPIPVFNIPTPVKPVSYKPTPSQLGGTIYVRSFVGRFQNLRVSIAGVLAFIFFATAWVNWNGHQAILWDLSERKFYVFGATFWPQDFSLLAFAMIISAFLLLAVTVFAGRVWCGYACPQSTWSWAFIWMEKITEGDSYQRVKLDSSPWSTNKILRKVSKHLLWALAALATGITFIGYFVPIRQLIPNLFNTSIESDYFFWIIITAVLTYLNAGWLREKVCTHMCPYARFQSVMFDKDTLIVAYDNQRGENRGSRKKDENYRDQGLGDCVDCHMCVQVCPTGIDIRNGLQMDCIGCAACVDACDSIMDKMGYARGLVSYTTERKLTGEQKITWRPQLISYITAVFIIIAALAFSINDREQISLSVYKDRRLFHANSAGDIINVYQLKITNKTQENHRYKINLENAEQLSLSKKYEIDLAPGERFDLPVSILLKRFAIKDSNGFINFHFKVTDVANANESILQPAIFIHPGRVK